MNYFDCKKLKRMIDKQRLDVAELREDAVSISVSADDMPRSGTHTSRTERAVERLAVEEARLVHLERRLHQAIVSIPDEYIRKMIRLKVCKGKSWNWIAQSMGGGNTGDSVRKICVRYKW